MDFQLEPLTEPGRRLVALAEAHAADFVTRAERHDREGSFPLENVEALRRSGVLAAFVPAELGGPGLESVHDFVLITNRLGRGDGSTAIAVSMHIYRFWAVSRAWHAARAVGDDRRAGALANVLREVAEGKRLSCGVTSEAATDLLHTLTEASPTENGWRLNGRKIFGTMAASCDILNVLCRMPDGRGGFRLASVGIPRGTPGLEIKETWDALGMRASGSHDVVLRDCLVPEGSLVDLGPWGEWSRPLLSALCVAFMGLTAVFLGIAEAATAHVVDAVQVRRSGSSGRRLAERYAVQRAVAEIEIELAAARAMLARSALLQGAYFETHAPDEDAIDDLHALMKDVQCTKHFVTHRAVEIVDRALTTSGGAGYLSRSPLSRLYRDVRAGPFMQPFSPNEAFEYIGKVTLGLDPRLDL